MNPGTLAGHTLSEVSEFILSAGFKSSDAHKICINLYRKRLMNIPEFGKISLKLRNFLSDNYSSGLFPPSGKDTSLDGTVKYLFNSADGRLFETVYIPYGERNTVCVSTQSGCRMGCSFCVTASYGFHGNLTAGEIVNQVLAIPEAEKITNVVLMGMGEPMDNLDNVVKACEILSSGWGAALSRRNITVSTVGILPEVERFLCESGCNLTLSLHSPFPEERSRLIPAERKHPVSSVIKIIREYPADRRRRFSLAYMMMDGVNDTDRHLEGLRSLVAGSSVRINLLPYHSSGNDTFRSSSEERMMFFKHSLVTSGISASIRKSRGSDISAACGLLASGLKAGIA
jgi:23S rRNA (adenine2503-C2)-methyltransferase